MAKTCSRSDAMISSGVAAGASMNVRSPGRMQRISASNAKSSATEVLGSVITRSKIRSRNHCRAAMFPGTLTISHSRSPGVSASRAFRPSSSPIIKIRFIGDSRAPGRRIAGTLSGGSSRAALIKVHSRLGGLIPDDDLHAAILLSTRGRIVIGDRLCLAKTLGGDEFMFDTSFFQILSHGSGPLFREFLIVFVTPNAVGMRFDVEVEPLGHHQDAGDKAEQRSRCRAQCRVG